MRNNFVLLLLVGLMLSCRGCGLAAIVGKAVPQKTAAVYSGLAGNSVGILVWADAGIMIEWGAIQLDLANSVNDKLLSSNAPEIKGTSWPYPPASYVKYMRDHPGLATAPITEIAPKFGVGRMIYIEVQNFKTRAVSEVELFRGEATVSLKVIEVDPNGAVKTAYSEDNITVVYPHLVPADGLPNIGDNQIYLGTVDEIATAVANRLVTHDTEPATGS